jgi:hypothetical protein
MGIFYPEKVDVFTVVLTPRFVGYSGGMHVLIILPVVVLIRGFEL